MAHQVTVNESRKGHAEENKPTNLQPQQIIVQVNPRRMQRH